VTVLGGAGDDIIYGATFRIELIDGGEGDDWINHWAYSSLSTTVRGGAGNDFILYSDPATYVSGGTGENVLMNFGAAVAGGDNTGMVEDFAQFEPHDDDPTPTPDDGGEDDETTNGDEDNGGSGDDVLPDGGDDGDANEPTVLLTAPSSPFATAAFSTEPALFAASENWWGDRRDLWDEPVAA
jgi:hypothetical protein